MFAPAVLLAAACALQGADKPFVSDAGGFRLKMPAAPKEQTQKIQTPIGPIDLHMYLIDKGDMAYLATYSDYPEEVAKQDPKQLLDGVVDGSIKNSKGELITSKDINIGGFPGREYDYNIPIPGGQTGIGRSRVYLVNTRLYQIVYIGAKAKGIPKAADDYLKSFELIKKPGAPAAKMPSSPATKKSATAPVVNKPFTSKEGGFRVVMPADPQERTQKLQTPIGPIDLHMYLIDKGDTAYLATYSDYPENVANQDPKQILDGVVDGSIKSSKGELITSKDIKIGGFPGREYDYKIPIPGGQTGLGRSRVYPVKSRLYQVVYIGTKDKTIPKAADDYLKSFALTKAPTP
jgi:hypothetical protein